MATEWIDLSVPVRNGMVHWPGDPAFSITRLRDFPSGDEFTLSHMDLGVHTGTHMDAPLHFVNGGETIDRMPLDATVGEARVVEIEDPESVKAEDVERANVREGERILFKTINSPRAWEKDEFHRDFVYISKEAASILARAKVRCIGVDYLSVGGFYKDGPETHHALLGAGIWVVEGLNLAPLKTGRYEFICLPLKLIDAEGAPARAIARPLAGNGGLA